MNAYGLPAQLGNPVPAGPTLRVWHAFVRLLPRVLLMSLIVSALQFGGSRAQVGSLWTDQLMWLIHLSAHWALGSLPLGMAFAILEARNADESSTTMDYGLAICTGSGVGALLLALHNAAVYDATTALAFRQRSDNVLYVLWLLLFWSTLGAILHASNRRFSRSARSLRVAEVAYVQSEQRLAQMRLAAMRAQIEPEFLLSSLTGLEKLYATDRAAAERLLDALIGFLRRALSLMRQSRTTVGQECRLAQDLMLTAARRSGARGGERRLEIDREVDDVLLPAAALLPAVQYVVASCPGVTHASAFAIRAWRVDDSVRVTVTTTAGIATAALPNHHDREASVAQLQQTLRTLCGQTSKIVVASVPGQQILEITVPIVAIEAAC